MFMLTSAVESWIMSPSSLITSIFTILLLKWLVIGKGAFAVSDISGAKSHGTFLTPSG